MGGRSRHLSVQVGSATQSLLKKPNGRYKLHQVERRHRCTWTNATHPSESFSDVDPIQ